MKNFWKNLPRPFFILAPMEDVTDIVFRGMVRKANENMPQVLFTEFTNCDGICSVGQSRVIHRLKYDPSQRPIVAQIWGKTPLNYEETAKLCLELGFDGIDINMGCPEKSVIKQGACSALINNKPLAKEIIEACKRGTCGQIPISVKTRIGFNKIQTEEWIGFLLKQNIQALTIHGRTVAGSDEPADWSEILKGAEINIRKNSLEIEKQTWINEINKLKNPA
jgi:tRNA-dihydrouridine synthase